ncbi:hypothetical protein [Streptomyces buecherae]|uniref:hypothetical protein n=1 Tax=Streptomyces buecherae TaxID=2763006 RepID=UPI003F540B66
MEFVNLARSGALVAEMVEAQLPAARRSRPGLASVVVGGNDTSRAAFDIGQLARALDLAMRGLRAEGAVLLTACLPDPGRALGLPRPLAAPDGPPPTFADGTWWLATRGTRWVFDRCRDLLPDQVRQAALESGHHLTGTAHLLDARARAATRGALTATRGAPARALSAGSAA